MTERYTGQDLQKILPHRGPALMIDDVIYDNEKPDELIGRKTVQPNDPWLNGHFPDLPIYPGHCQIECANLVAAALIKLKYPELNGKPMIARIGEISFKKPIFPGANISIHVQITSETKKTFFTFDAKITNTLGEVLTIISGIKGINNNSI